jgi:hypothetical protein
MNATVTEHQAGALEEYSKRKLELAGTVRNLLNFAEQRKDEMAAGDCRRLLARLAEDRFNLAFVGQFSRGKSSLMNAILGAEKLPTGILPLTSVITTVAYGETERVLLQREGWLLPQEIRMEQLPDYVTQSGNPGNEKKVTLAEIQLPHELLRLLTGGFSNYHALQVKFEHRSSSVNFLNSFTWSKAIDNVSQVLEEQGGSTGTPQDIHNLANDRGLSGYDVPFLNVTSAVWEIPVGKGRHFGATLPRFLDGAVGGWKISAINTMRSGRTANLRYITSGPTPVTSGLPTFLGGVTLRPNLLGDPMAPESTRSINGYFNKANIVVPPATQPFGNAGRNIIRGYPFYQLDLGLQKEFALPMRENSFVEFRAEAFNLLNKTNFGGPNADLSSSSFGLIRSAYPARQLQFAARFVF